MRGHQIPLVFTGKLKRTIISNARVTATKDRGRLQARGYFPMTAQRRAEIEVVSNREEQLLAQEYEKDYEQMANQPRFRRKRKRK